MIFARNSRLNKLQEELNELKRQLSDLKYDVLNAVEKTQRWMQRQIKRAEREEDEPLRPTPASGGNANIDPISRKILERRSALTPKLPTED